MTKQNYYHFINSPFLSAFSDNPSVECRKKFRVYRTFLLIEVKTFPGGSMWKMIGRGIPNILLFLYREG